ncbi:GntR domain protein [Ancylobacter novellus DSM 506]|uniref:GntR domain protein n=1 Tax=Ancylobacter novellus (strain ATCC 8093 / DSM 506 / JCM 20403 / CCM 1077 / IAM 12100 / NBRC 12443 / NCIMB 10456) TaxID=639283 RepID=D6ZZ68_ANCN5|nr:FCD domain-containing protein [Ancylobacter novellus]ADH89204.1 GntR domain protein [Ancylobacter novellus DSM 506]
MTLYHDTLERLGKDICAGRYRPGQVIPAEPLLCAQLGVSRIVLREAIKGLASKGLLEARRRTGTVVLEQNRWSLLDPEVMIWRADANGVDLALGSDIMELRRIIEPAAARLAAERARPEELAALRAAYEAMAAAAVDGQGDYVAADIAFHSTIIRACSNPFVTQLQSVMSTVLRICFERVAAVPGGRIHSLPLHRRVCEAIEQRRPSEAGDAIIALLDDAESDMRRLLNADPGAFLTPAQKASAAEIQKRADQELDRKKSDKALEERHDRSVLI